MITKIGEHIVKHGDLNDGIDDLISEPAYIFYSDPPWGQGHLNYWQTINEKMTGALPQKTNLSQFLNNFFNLAVKHTSDWILIEYGIRWQEKIVELGKKHGLYYLGFATPKYRAGSKLYPLNLHIFNKKNINVKNEYLDSITATNGGMDTLRKAVLPISKPGAIILDPACGKGYVARIAVEAKMRFRGNELNAKRLDETIKFLKRATKSL